MRRRLNALQTTEYAIQTISYTVKTSDLEPAFSQVTLNKFLRKW